MTSNLNKKILVVEDDTDMRNLLVDKLLLKHYEIIQAEDGEQAVAKILAHRPDLILLDLILPKRDGFAVLEWIRRNNNLALALIPVIILSNLNRPKDLQTAEDLKVDNYFVKAQTEIETVCQRVEEILANPATAPSGWQPAGAN
ncbi:MAG: response regulator [Patescibacteria group bacterium]|nr:response regulator [Patescibacteria group bacterium]